MSVFWGHSVRAHSSVCLPKAVSPWAANRPLCLSSLIHPTGIDVGGQGRCEQSKQHGVGPPGEGSHLSAGLLLVLCLDHSREGAPGLGGQGWEGNWKQGLC